MPTKQKKILIADDDPEDLELIEEFLLNVHPDINLHKVRNGKAVIEYLEESEKKEFPSLIILDYSMPEYNAVQVLSILNTDARYNNLPVIVLSTSDSPVFINQCKDHGALEYFVKPNTIQELEATIHKILALIT